MQIVFKTLLLFDCFLFTFQIFISLLDDSIETLDLEYLYFEHLIDPIQTLIHVKVCKLISNTIFSSLAILFSSNLTIIFVDHFQIQV